MTPGLQSLAEAASWLRDLVPFLIAPLILLLVWEVVVLLAAILGLRSEPPEAERTRSRTGTRTPSGRLLNLALLCAAASLSCDAAPTGPGTRAPVPDAPAFSTTMGNGYTAIDLGTLGGSWSYANGINESGQVVGLTMDAAEWGRAFLWTDGFMTALEPLPEPVGCSVARGSGWANDINGAGQVVGGSGIGFLWQDGVAIALASMPGGCTEAYAINDAGWVVGDGGDPGFLWHDGVYTNLDFIPADVNNAGQITGTGTGFTARRWENGVTTDLGTLGGYSSVAFGMNDAGDVVGASLLTGNQIRHAFLWHDGTMTDLGTLGGARGSEARAINNHGQVVGWSFTDGDAEVHAFLWQDGVMTDLGTLGGTWSEAYDINEAGWIVGLSTIASGAPFASHATMWRILTPVEAIEGLSRDVETLASADALPGQSASSLLSKLKVATAMLNDGKSRAAIQQLEAFILQVEGLSAAGRLDPDLGQPLIDAARVLIGRLD